VKRFGRIPTTLDNVRPARLSVGHETKSFERCKAILVSRVFGGFRVSSEYFANVSDAARVGLDGQHCKIRFLRPLLDVPT
jgi:hypothetical protein